MPDSPQPSPYRVDYFPGVDQQIRDVSEQATDLGLRGEFFAAIRHIIDRLKADPVAFGEPEYHTVYPGGVVCHGGHNPVFVRYAVYQQERVVVILLLALMPALPQKPGT